jgi:two-component system chemotaxis response regulator CheY
MKKIKAMVIDDSRVMRLMVMKSLREAGLAEFEFQEAEDGEDALAKILHDRPEILFVDWNMPKMSGIDLVKRFRRDRANDTVPVVMVTSEKTMGKIEEALDQAGANEYICKPFTVDQLRQKLPRMLEIVEQKKPAGGFFSKVLGS